jgi:hypothetical protein
VQPSEARHTNIDPDTFDPAAQAIPQNPPGRAGASTARGRDRIAWTPEPVRHRRQASLDSLLHIHDRNKAHGRIAQDDPPTGLRSDDDDYVALPVCREVSIASAPPFDTFSFRRAIARVADYYRAVSRAIGPGRLKPDTPRANHAWTDEENSDHLREQTRAAAQARLRSVPHEAVPPAIWHRLARDRAQAGWTVIPDLSPLQARGLFCRARPRCLIQGSSRRRNASATHCVIDAAPILLRAFSR